ncbi:WD repeat-containing protein 93 [Aulostomus maculatus]
MTLPYRAERSMEETPILELSSTTELPESTNCLACSDDGQYLGLGHSRGLSVWCASPLVCVTEWLQDRLEITSLQMTNMTETAYLLGSIDDMGVARVFAFHAEALHLLSVINTMEDVNKRSICLTFELSKGGNYGAASISCNSVVWLEVYHLPLEAWLKELQGPNLSGKGKWSPLGMPIKAKPPRNPAGTALQSTLEISDILTQSCLALDEGNDAPRRCTPHFLLPCGPFAGDSKERSDLPVAVCLWWSGSRNLLQYLLQKAPKTKPDVLWPNTEEILCSAVSGCTRFIALGLTKSLVCVWDRFSGSPLPVSVVPTDSTFSRLLFVAHWPASADDSWTLTAAAIHLMVVCKSGAIHTVTTGRGTKSCSAQLSKRPKDSGDLPTISASVPFLQGLSLVVQRNGKMFLKDAINKTTLCFLVPPTTHLLTTPCSPVYALNIKQQILFVRGDPDPSCGGSSEGDSQSQLFIFRFGDSFIFKQYIVFPPNCPQQQKTLNFVALEETCNLYLQQRALSADGRNKAIKETWKQLQDSAVMAQQRHERTAAGGNRS